MADADQHDAGDGRCLEWPAVVNSPDTTLQGSETILGPDTLPSLGAEYRELGQNAGELLPQIRNVMTSHDSAKGMIWVTGLSRVRTEVVNSTRVIATRDGGDGNSVLEELMVLRSIEIIAMELIPSETSVQNTCHFTKRNFVDLDSANWKVRRS